MSALLEILKFIGIILCVLLVFNFVILVHEWGHFLAARWRGLKIEKFQIWMGKPIWKRTWNGVQYGLGTIPIGGFVQLPQMAPMSAIEGKTAGEELPPIKPLDKIIVAFAGPLFSLGLAFVFACGVWKFGQITPQPPVVGFAMPGAPAYESGLIKPGDRILEVDGQPVANFFGLTRSVVWAIASGENEDVKFKLKREGVAEPVEVTVHAPYKEGPDYKKWDTENSWLQKLYRRPPVRRVGIAPAALGKVKEVMENSPAAEAGFKPGDIIETLNGEKCHNPEWLGILASKFPEKPIKAGVLRGSEHLELTVIPRKPEQDPRAEADRTAMAGVFFEELNAGNPELHYPSPFTLVADCFRNTAATLQKLVTPKSPIGVSQMSGPVGILNVYYNIFKSDAWWHHLLWFSVVLNVGLAIFNMLPLPVLDGGHIVNATIEAIRRRPPNLKLMEYLQVGCVLCLLSFVLFVTLKDVGSLAEGGGGGEIKFLPKSAPPAAPAP